MRDLVHNICVQLLLPVLFLVFSPKTHAFCVHPSTVTVRQQHAPTMFSGTSNHLRQDARHKWISPVSTLTRTTFIQRNLRPPSEDEIDDFLDTPFFEPDKVLEDENSSQLSKKFAGFVKNDYETAEALLVGAFFVVLIIITQEVLRVQIHGENYVPFTKGGNGLF